MYAVGDVCAHNEIHNRDNNGDKDERSKDEYEPQGKHGRIDRRFGRADEHCPIHADVVPNLESRNRRVALVAVGVFLFHDFVFFLFNVVDELCGRWTWVDVVQILCLKFLVGVNENLPICVRYNAIIALKNG